MPRTEAQKQWQRKQRAEGNRCVITMDVKTSERDKWKAYAAFKGLPLATLIRQHMAAAMAADGWTYSGPGETGEREDQE